MSRLKTVTIFNGKLFEWSRKLLFQHVLNELHYREYASGDCILNYDFYDMEIDELEDFATYLDDILNKEGN